jgi:RNA polymerase sigma-70 factor (ECF subfamily)
MYTTSISLLERLRQPGQQQAWERFVQIYTPLLYYWARHLGLQTQDAADLVQEIFTTLVQKLPEYAYDPNKSFRSWLHTVCLNKWRDLGRRRSEKPLDPKDNVFADLAVNDPTEGFLQSEYARFVLGRALQVMQRDFEPTTWKACWEALVMDRSPADVAAELGIRVGAVYVAKSRVLSRLRQELNGLLD